MIGNGAHRCLSQLVVERYLHDELTAAECARIEASMTGCEHCKARVHETRAEEAAFALRPVPVEIRRMWTDPVPRRSWIWLKIAMPAAAVAAAVLALLLLTGTDETDGEYIAPFDEGARRTQVRIMGSERTALPEALPPDAQLKLGFYVLDGDREVKGESGQLLKGGDRIQFWYDAPSDGAAVIVGIDGRNQVTRYFPAGPAPSGELRRGAGRLIKSSVILDDTPGVERFYLCFGDVARDPAAVESAARKIVGSGNDTDPSARLPLDCTQTSIWIEKDR